MSDKAYGDTSPTTNPDLLQRSEVVALFNTLHRVAESLDAVQTFRRMYAAEQAAAAEAAHGEDSELESEGASQTGRRARQDELATTTHSWLGSSPAAVGTALLAVLEAVRRSCKGCVGAVARWLAGGVGKTEL